MQNKGVVREEDDLVEPVVELSGGRVDVFAIRPDPVQVHPPNRPDFDFQFCGLGFGV
jgi:hypothetical protein